MCSLIIQRRDKFFYVCRGTNNDRSMIRSWWILFLVNKTWNRIQKKLKSVTMKKMYIFTLSNVIPLGQWSVFSNPVSKNIFCLFLSRYVLNILYKLLFYSSKIIPQLLIASQNEFGIVCQIHWCAFFCESKNLKIYFL